MTDLRKTAVYIRLSAEDDNVDGRAKKESDSVTSQRILLKSFEKNTENETDDLKKIPGRDCDFKGQLGVISDRNAAYFGGDHRPDFDIQKSTDRFSQYDF